MPPSRTKEDWKALLGPLLSTSIQAVNERLMQTDEIQKWLRSASTEAAEGMNRQPDMRGEMRGYTQLKTAFEKRFPELLAAVDELTEGCGTIDVDWTPMNPALSSVEVRFDRDLTIDLFTQLDVPTPEAARSVLDTVVAALPEGTPFPNRPNSVTGLVAYNASCMGVRVREHLGDDRHGQYRTVTLLPHDRDAVKQVSVENAPSHLLQELAPADSSSVA